MFLKVAEDDRSDNDENEYKEEQRLDALERQARLEKEQGITSASSPQVLVNGQTMNANGNGHGKSTATPVRTNGTTNRKENVRKGKA